MDGSSVMWMYHSHVDEVADDYAGLVGPIIVTRADMARADGTPTDVDMQRYGTKLKRWWRARSVSRLPVLRTVGCAATVAGAPTRE
jgi:hypothetical protein